MAINPFLLKGYTEPEYFCDRKKETKSIIDSINNQQDITLYAYRRLGKSALIHHIFYQLRKKYYCIYADVWGTASYHDFTRELTNAILKSDAFSKRTFSQKISEFVKSIGASISIGLDGTPSVDMMLHERNQSFRNLEEIFSFLNQLDKPTILSIDEFQEIRNYKGEQPLEAKLRSLSQQNQNIRFIYSGSEFHLINEMFNKFNSPFYQSTRMLHLEKIEQTSYHDFIFSHFNKAKKKISPIVIDEILRITHRHTFYVQSICNYLFSLDESINTIPDFDKHYFQLLKEKGVFYEELPKRLTQQQFMTLKAISEFEFVDSPNSKNFLQKSHVHNPSSMQRIMKSLTDQQFIIKENEGFRLYDVFLEHYLKYVAH